MLTKMQAMGFDPNLGLDQYFYNKATTDKKTVIGLETVKFQIDLFDSLAEGNQDAYMKRALKELDLFETMLNELMQSWKQGDIDGLGKLMLESFDEYPGLYDRFVVDRNKTWIKKVDHMVSKNKTHMVVVGAAHLPGMVSAMTTLPVLGVPVQSKALQGLDSLLSIVQMPGGVPTATFAIGKAGATNAALFAIQILALNNPKFAEAMAGYRVKRISWTKPSIALGPWSNRMCASCRSGFR